MGRKVFFSAILAGALFSYSRLPSWGGEVNPGGSLYLKHCASCHGPDGRGKGPVSPYLKVKMPDLTALKKSNKGVFPLARVMSAIDGTRPVPGHGDASMPVWGEVFREELKEKKYTELTSLLKTKAIAEYIATLQR